MKRHLLTATIAVFIATILLAGHAEARGGGMLSPSALKGQRRSAVKMARTLRKYKVPRSIQMAPIRAVRSAQKMDRLRGGKIKVNNNAVLPTKGTSVVTANRGLVNYKQQITGGCAQPVDCVGSFGAYTACQHHEKDHKNKKCR